PNHADLIKMIARILQAHELAQNIQVRDVVEMIDRFSSKIQDLFAPKSILVETPFRQLNSNGQQAVGYIDLMLETTAGFVIIDHKSFMGRRTDWPEKTLSYSGQLEAYRACHPEVPVKSTWIHFSAGGGMVKIGDPQPAGVSEHVNSSNLVRE